MRTAWWSRAPSPGNLGDMLTPVVLRGIGVPVRWAPYRSAEIMAIGSVIRFARPQHTVWGSGAMRASDRPTLRARYLAVRGPRTRACVEAAGGTCPEVYGDPAMLLPEFTTESVPRVHDLGIVPHYVDHDSVKRAYPDERVIEVLRADPMEVVREIRECRAVVSSSLHGIIVAHAFGIPTAWFRWSDGLNGDDTKFHDHADAVGVALKPHPTPEDAAEALTTASYDPSPLLDAAKALSGLRKTA